MTCRFFLEHFNLHRSTNWWKRSVFMERFLNSQLMHNKKVYQQPIQLEQLGDNLLDKAKEFISSRGQENTTGPFALYYAFPEVHTPLVPAKRFKGKSKHGAYGDR